MSFSDLLGKVCTEDDDLYGKFISRWSSMVLIINMQIMYLYMHMQAYHIFVHILHLF